VVLLAEARIGAELKAAQERGEAFSVEPDTAANSNTASVAAGDPVAA